VTDRVVETPPFPLYTRYPQLPPPLPQPQPDDYRRLPPAFHRFFEAEAQDSLVPTCSDIRAQYAS
jgi:hypothetical protein